MTPCDMDSTVWQRGGADAPLGYSRRLFVVAAKGGVTLMSRRRCSGFRGQSVLDSGVGVSRKRIGLGLDSRWGVKSNFDWRSNPVVTKTKALRTRAARTLALQRVARSARAADYFPNFGARRRLGGSSHGGTTWWP